MKSYIAAGALLAAFAQSQSIADLPSCSLDCIVTGVSGIGCSATDFTCSCDKSAELTATLEPCVQAACPAASDQAAVVSVLEGICSSVGVPITIAVPTSSAAATSSAPASSVEASSTPAMSSSMAAATSSGSICTTSTTYTTVTVGPTGVASASYGTNGTVTTAAPTAFTGGAAANGVVFGAAGLMGFLAYIL